jgi:hypothetical protein
LPAQYEKNTQILVFLDKDDNKYSTHALTYGLKTLEQSEYEIYKSRILEIQKILKITDKKERRIKTVDWLIDCASNPVTKWEGLQDLAPQSDFISYYDFQQLVFTQKDQYYPFIKTWDFIKYYHPDLTSRKIDADSLFLANIEKIYFLSTKISTGFRKAKKLTLKIRFYLTLFIKTNLITDF